MATSQSPSSFPQAALAHSTEQQVLRLRQEYGSVVRERDESVQENKRLRELAAAHGIQIDDLADPTSYRETSTTGHGSKEGTKRILSFETLLENSGILLCACCLFDTLLCTTLPVALPRNSYSFLTISITSLGLGYSL